MNKWILIVKQFLCCGNQKGGIGTLTIVLIAAIVIAGLLIWLAIEPTWLESLFGVTRWDKLLDIFDFN